MGAPPLVFGFGVSMRVRDFVLCSGILASGCSFHSVATHWNGRVGPDGHPVYVRNVTNIGINIAVVLPLLGKTTIDEMIDEATLAIAKQDSDHVRVIETSSENYWHGFPPFTWILTPVITTLGVEYRPSEKELAMTYQNETEIRKQTPEQCE